MPVVMTPATCSPRTWGWTAYRFRSEPLRPVFPTHVGMDRRMAMPATSPTRVPHARGDGPFTDYSETAEQTCSPRTWGWTDQATRHHLRLRVFPTHVGMDRWTLQPATTRPGVPHARGDGPAVLGGGEVNQTCSPRTWGWTVLSNSYGLDPSVFPTHVGMDRPFSGRAMFTSCVPTHVGMDRKSAPYRRWFPCVPHARGDGPFSGFPQGIWRTCSPRTWGWTE